MARTLAIDYGLKRIGLALSDPTKTIATALPTLLAERQAQKTIDKLLVVMAAHDIDEIIVGLPYRMSGKMGLQADEVVHFVEQLKLRTQIPIVLWDERLTSVQAERLMREASMTRKRRSQLVDQLSAVIILQSYLQSRQNS